MADPAMLLGALPDGLASLDPTARTIVTAARTCFTERGFSNTTMQDIAEGAGVGVATVYRRFRHKRNLVRLTIMDESLRLSTLISEVAGRAGSPEEGIAEVFAAFVHEASAPKLLTRSIRESPAAGELSAYLTDEHLIAMTRGYIATWLRRWQERGELAADLDTEIVGEMIGRLIISLIKTPESVIPIYNPNEARDFARRYLVPLALRAPARTPS
ncbi:TetR/AcrR family transcriptional regulator [Mycobacterium intracellulare]|uniref:TetR family transcriptional regulator n=1 Tax=Mycobacterium intracellulare subsp. chimaera TaxID=222805 RepID=A0A7U5RW06_MYCIT|nr:TetR/AcrR family transcriptional regulator [Mycobacterium intracellulare]AOS92336.1 TetR family transcriptional regulator [Mycobacterium intracellulare subsp. chimaera]ASL15414.1 TetR family transcriptional regulator [Mycobacterium intracellulare subsp. chimaera]MCA2308020.1 TetR/AcrR family transcriptional regulator [Mycobacterium intracellulare subsp. chimaera]MCA2352519.1 TetR/AcrR family transcriptional regulator [Mycobacterium intracellulare subsp. chimaera]MDM3927653.1 TetR/AcrR famil